MEIEQSITLAMFISWLISIILSPLKVTLTFINWIIISLILAILYAIIGTLIIFLIKLKEYKG